MIRALAILAALTAGPATAETCRLALALALDVSSSVDALEDKYQRRGLANALIAPRVQRAFFSSPEPVALAVYEWSHFPYQRVLLDWRLIREPADLRDVASRLGTSTRGNSGQSTALGRALVFGAQMLQRGPDCSRKTIDVSGDGQNNDGPAPRQTYASFDFGDIQVNGLAIVTRGFSTGAFTTAPVDIPKYYQKEVIRGPDAFVEVAQSFGEFEQAMRRKLERELRAMSLSALDID